MAPEYDPMITEIRALTDDLAEQIPLLHAKHAGAELYGAPRLSWFDLLRPKEPALSRVLADLFDPKGRHGQGPLFLNALLGRFDLERVRLHEVVRVRCEVATDEGRFIDVIIETDKYLIGIENKPSAAESSKQLFAYSIYLKTKAASVKKDTLLIFLSNREPTSAEGEEVSLLRYSPGKGPSLLDILSSTIISILAPRTRTFIEDLIAHLESRFGERMMSDANQSIFVSAVLDEYEKSGQKRKALASVLFASSRLRDTALDELGEFFIKTLREQVGGVLSFISDQTLTACLRKHQFWGFRKDGWPSTCWVGLEVLNSDYGNVIFGVLAPDELVSASDRAIYGFVPCLDRGGLDAHFKDLQGNTPDKWWAWCRKAPKLDVVAVGEAVLHSESGRLYEASEMRGLLQDLVYLARKIDSFVDKQTSPSP